MIITFNLPHSLNSCHFGGMTFATNHLYLSVFFFFAYVIILLNHFIFLYILHKTSLQSYISSVQVYFLPKSDAIITHKAFLKYHLNLILHLNVPNIIKIIYSFFVHKPGFYQNESITGGCFVSLVYIFSFSCFMAFKNYSPQHFVVKKLNIQQY